MKYIHIDYKNNIHLQMLTRFYENVFSFSFYNSDTRESLDNMLHQLKRGYESKTYDYDIIAIVENDVLIAALFADYFYDTQSSVIEYITVDPTYRNKNIGSNLFEYYISSKSNLRNLFIEIENHGEESIPTINFWNKHGFRKIDYDYHQPPLSNDKEGGKLTLAIKYLKDNKDSVSKELLSAVLDSFFKECFDYPYNKSKEILSNSMNDSKNEYITLKF